jgi:transposase
MLKTSDARPKRIQHYFPEENIRMSIFVANLRQCVKYRVLWVLNTGVQWKMLPQSYPATYNTWRLA